MTTPTTTPVTTNKRFAGWWVVGSVFLLFVANSGFTFYGLAIYLDALTDEQGFSTTSVSLATSMFFVVSGIAGRLIAPLIETRDIRWVIGTGAAITSGSLLALGSVDTIPKLYGVYTVFAIGFALCGLVPGTTLITRWFHTRRSVALSVASTGLSVGGLTLTKVASSLIDTRGLDNAAPILAVGFLVIVAITLPTMWPSPESRGTVPDGVTPAPKSEALTQIAASVDYHTAIRTRFFMVIVVGFVLAMGSQVGALSQIAKLGTERVDRPTGALALSALAGTSVIARLIGGVVVGKTSIMKFTAALALLQGVALVSLAYADTSTELVLSAALFGATIGNLLMLQPLIVAAAFGVTGYPKIFAFMQLIVTFGIAGGPFLLGYLHDAASYQTSYLVGACVSVGGGIAFALSGNAHPTPETVVV
ncbi:MAG: MFS transporter [Acidimicrobiaceae bacterium]|nr:MFS transporter [Acidimicrobiaceae bacterium]